MEGPAPARAVYRSKQQACEKREMIDEKTELGLVSVPSGRTMKGACKKHYISCGEQGGFSKKSAGEKANRERRFK